MAQQALRATAYEERWVEALNRGDISAADEVFAPGCVVHITGSPARDLPLEGFKQMVAGLLAAFPDLRFTIEDQVVAADRVATRWLAEGTHTGPLGEVPPTGRRIRVDGLILDRIDGGRVIERWEQWDQPAMLRQLGLA
jgi:steroid delta-isomerase-like uncharacterized protein